LGGQDGQRPYRRLVKVRSHRHWPPFWLDFSLGAALVSGGASDLVFWLGAAFFGVPPPPRRALIGCPAWLNRPASSRALARWVSMFWTRARAAVWIPPKIGRGSTPIATIRNISGARPAISCHPIGRQTTWP